jgi:histidine triad (HIT) family protein
MMEVAPRIGAAMMRATGADGFNLLLANGACAGQVVPHAHLHVVPRFPADGLLLPARSVPYANAEAKAKILDEARRRLSA